MPTHSRTGFSNALPGETLFQMPFTDPTKYSTYFNDCFNWSLDDWTETVTEAGIGTSDITNGVTGVGGTWYLETAANENDGAFYQLGGATFGVAEPFIYTATKKFFFKSRWKLSDATQSDAICGLAITDTTPIGASDGMYFSTVDGDAELLFTTIKTGGTTVTTLADLADDTFVTTGFYYDGISKFHIFVDDVKVAEHVNTYGPDDEATTLTFGALAGAAGADFGTWDYFLVSMER